MNLKVITETQSEPLTIDEVKLHLRVDGDEENTLISNLITTSREFCENFTARSISNKTYELVLDSFPSLKRSIKIPMPPLKSVISFKYFNENGEEKTLVEDTDFLVATSLEPAEIFSISSFMWPSDYALRPDSVKIRFTAGYDIIPKSIKQAMLLLIGHLYENRQATANKKHKELPLAVSSLLMPYKVYRW